ncbi:hypothetical protein SDJN02_16282 [Cucurbita argyrosperma subsp. argyrosperma]|nr:hypothetical protein SDJN02_16282 [Cucurbita argyrosperma subsp. argyrosperma]
MSLALLQGYSSAEEEAEDTSVFNNTSSDDDDQDLVVAAASTVTVNLSIRDRSLFELPQPSSHPGLPSAFDAFSEVSGPPEFLNNSVEEFAAPRDVDRPRGGRRNRRDKKDLPTGAVLEAKAQLVGIHERVRSDVENNQPSNPSISNTTQAGKRVATATNPNAEDAAELLRMCLHCGIPKTFSNARGMFCPLCGDRPPEPELEPDSETKKKGSTVKDKEKIKRMRGQSSHATWKSETEMQLRQQFD